MDLYKDRYLKIISELNPNCFFEDFEAKDGKFYTLISSNYFKVDNDENKCNNEIKVVSFEKSLSSGHPLLLGFLDGEFYDNNDIAYLGMIALKFGRYSQIGIGSKMLKVFEESVLNRNISHISGVFAPFNLAIANENQVKSFYEKNGYGFCVDTCNSLDSSRYIYKNFDKNGVALKPIDNYEETPDYKYTMSPYFISHNRDNNLKDTFFLDENLKDI